MKPIILDVHPEDVEYAEKYSSQSTRFDHRTFFIGKLGERCVIRYLRERNVSLAEDWTEVNRPDYYDIATTADILDVKTTTGKLDRLLVSRDSFYRGRRFSFYIAVRLTDDAKKAEIWGYATAKDMESANVMEGGGGRKLLWMPYSGLRPFSELAEYMEKSTTRNII